MNLLTAGCGGVRPAPEAALPPTAHTSQNAAVARRLRSVVADPALDRSKRAVLRGLLWTLELVDADENFEFIAADYLLMLHELTLRPDTPVIREAAESLIRNALARLSKQLQTFFPPTANGKWRFISIAPYIYEFDVEAARFESYYRLALAPIDDQRHEISFQDAVNERDYDAIGDYLIEQFQLDRLLRKVGPAHLKLPVNRLPDFLARIDELQFIYDRRTADQYSIQNYFVTHLVYVLSDFGAKRPALQGLALRLSDYLAGNFHDVRHVVNDLDLLAEFVHCLKILGESKRGDVREAEAYLLAQQQSDGSWTTPYYKSGDPYDQFHPTWTALIAIHYRTR